MAGPPVVNTANRDHTTNAAIGAPQSNQIGSLDAFLGRPGGRRRAGRSAGSTGPKEAGGPERVRVLRHRLKTNNNA